MKINKKLLTGVLIIAFMLLFSNMCLAAKGTFSLSKSSVKLKEGKTTTFNIKVSNCEGKFTISSSNTSVAKVSTSSEWVSGSTTVTITAVKAGKANITVTASNVGDTDENDVTGSKTISVTVEGEKKTTTTNTTTDNNKTTDTKKDNDNTSTKTTTKTPNFKSTNKKVYTKSSVNLRSSCSTSSDSVGVPINTELTLTGTSTEKVNGYVWSRVKYNGATKYVVSSFLTTKKPEVEEEDDSKKKPTARNNANLSSLTIDGVELEPAFDKIITEYTATVGSEVDDLEVKTKTENSKAKVSVVGNKDLKAGENEITIRVTAQDATIKNYIVKVTKDAVEGQNEDTASENEIVDDGSLKLSSLDIKGVDFQDGFNPNQYSYELDLNVAVHNLEITATPNKEDAQVEITGNENFVEGENLVTILLTSADGEETATYQIKVNMTGEVVETNNDLQNYIMIGSIALAVVAIIIIVVIVIKRRREDDGYEEEDEDSDIENSKLSDDTNLEEKSKRPRGKHSV